MSQTENNIASANTDNEAEGSLLEDLDLVKISEIFRKSILWIILLVALSLSGAYLYLRYTKPLFESTSSLKLTIEDEKTIKALEGIPGLGLGGRDDEQYLIGELEFIRSDVILDVVIEELDMKVDYFAQGNILDNNLFRANPIKLSRYEVKDSRYYDMPFYVSILNEKEYKLTYQQGNAEQSRKATFGERVSLNGFWFELALNGNYNAKMRDNDYYFKINSRGVLSEQFRQNLSVIIQNKNAKIIAISYKDHNQDKARSVVAAIDSAYLVRSVEERNKSNQQQIKWLEEQLERYEDSLAIYESKIQGFVLENKTKNVDEKINKAFSIIEELTPEKIRLNEQLSVLRQLEDLLNTGRSLEEFVPNLQVIENEAIVAPIKEIQALLMEKELLLLRKKETTYEYKKLSKQVRVARESIIKQISYARKQLYRKVREIQTKLIEAENSIVGLPSQGREFNRLERLYAIYEEIYIGLLNKRIEVKVAEAGVVPEFVILSPASYPSVPISPKKLQIYAIALGIGIFLGLGVVVIRYLLHDTVTNQRELERVVKVPIMGGVPEYKRRKMPFTKLIVHHNPKSSISESLRSIRTNLEFILPQGKALYNPDTKLLFSISSTISGEGKTFVATNLGGIIATPESKVVILDFDMRKPKLHIAFDATNERGVSSILIGRTKVEDCIHHSEVENLDFITSGPTPPNPSELILREDFDELIRKLHETYNVIIIDTPPVGLVTDGILIMKKVDVALYVVRAGYSKKGFGRNVNNLARSNSFNLGVILNAVKRTGRGYGGYGSYGSYGGYGGYYGGGYYEDEPEKKTLWQRLFKKKKK